MCLFRSVIRASASVLNSSSVKLSGLPLYRRALKQPQHAKRALRMMADIGVQRTISLIKGRIDSGMPVGYSAAGEIIEVGAEVESLSVATSSPARAPALPIMPSSSMSQ